MSSLIDDGGEREEEERNRKAIYLVHWYRDCPAHYFRGQNEPHEGPEGACRRRLR